MTAGGVLMLFGAWQEYNATAAERAAAAPSVRPPRLRAPAAPAAPAEPMAPPPADEGPGAPPA